MNHDSVPSTQKKNQFPTDLAMLAMLVVVVWGLWAGQSFFIPLSLSALLAFLASPLLRFLEGRKVPEWLALVVATLAFLLPVAWVFYMLVRQIQALISDYPAIVTTLQKWAADLANTPWGQRLHLNRQFTFDAVVSHIGSGAGEGVKILAHGLRTILEASTEGLLILIFAVIMLASRDHVYESCEKILVRFETIEAKNLLQAVTEMIEKFLVTKLLVIAIVGVFSFFFLQVLGLKYAFLLGMITGILTLIPEVGFAISLLPVAVVAIATGHSFGSILALLGSMVVVHLIEANVFTPKLVGKKLNLNILSTFVGLFAGGLLWGVWGMLLSVPVLGIMRIVFSASPALEPLAFFLSEKEDKQLGLGLMSKALRAERVKLLLSRTRQTTQT